MTSWLKRIPLRDAPELDVIRFISILLVVLHHQFMEDTALLRWFARHGWIGVDVFFGMSGYLITTLLLKELTKTEGIDLKSFWYRRMLRLWPSWLLTLALSYVMVYALSRNNLPVREGLDARWWHYFLHFGNYSYILYGKIHTLYSHFWSLAVEEHFYLFWPLLLTVFPKRRQVLTSVWILIASSWLLRLYHLGEGHGVHVLSFSTHTRMDQLLLGCLLAFYMPRIKDLAVGSEAFITILMGSLYWLGMYVCKDNSQSSLLNSLTYSVIGVATCLLVIIALKGGSLGLRRLLQFPFAAKLGVLSYGVYLIHLHVNYIVFPLLKRFPVVQDQSLVAMINLILPFIPAYFMYVYVDGWFSKYKHRKATALNPRTSEKTCR